MADNDNALYLALCKLKELFKGRFTTEECGVLLMQTEGHLDLAVKLIFDNEPSELRQLIGTERNSWTTVESKTRRMRRDHEKGVIIPSILDRAKSGKIDTTARLFACGPCDSSWWRRTPQRKLVSRCNRCRTRYDAVPREKEWGWAEFKCPHPGCGREFGGWCAMDMTSPCYGCSRPINPARILPPDKKQVKSRRNTHSCGAPDCANYRGTHNHPPIGHYGRRVTCVHPQTRETRNLPKVITPSQPHDSSGSTVDTFLSQTDLTKDQEIFYPNLDSVQEADEDQDDRSSLSGHPGSDHDEGPGEDDNGVANGNDDANNS